MECVKGLEIKLGYRVRDGLGDLVVLPGGWGLADLVGLLFGTVFKV